MALRSMLSGLCFFGLAVAAVVLLLAEEGSWLERGAGGMGVALMLTFIALEISRAKPVQVWTSAILLVLGLLAILLSGKGLVLVFEGLERNLQYLLLLASIVWLQIQATQSPSLLELRQRVMRMPSGSRSVSIMFVAFALGSAFNIAAFGLMAPLVSPSTPQALRERLIQAVSKGFMLATSWSPLFVGTAVILIAVEGVSWTDVGFGGFLVGLYLLALQWGFDGIYRKLDPNAASARKLLLEQPQHESSLALSATLFRAMLIILSLFACIMVAVVIFELSIPVSLALAAPLFGLSWAWLIRREQGAEAFGPWQSVGQVFGQYPNLRGEALLFAAANIFGVGAQAWLDTSLGQAGLSMAEILGWPEPVLLVACIVGFFSICVVGMHPLISVILLTTLFAPDDLGLEPWQFAVLMMALWGTGTNASPVSATAILLSRMTELSNFRLAWRVNMPFSLLNVAALIVLFLVLQAI